MKQEQLTEFRERYLNAQLRGDRSGAVKLVLEAVEAGAAVPEVHLQIIVAAQREIGRLWQENKLGIAQEHLATGISQLALARLYEQLPRRAPNGYSVVVACVEGEQHDFGARVAADFLEMAGFDVRSLGADVPLKSLLDLLRQNPPHLLALSITMSFHGNALREAVKQVREAFGGRIAIGAGGHALSWDPTLATSLQLDFSGRDAQELVDSALRLMRLPERAA